MKRIIILAVFLFPFLAGYSQYSKEVKRAFLDGEYFLALESYPDALEGYQKVYQADPENANINYRVGICYLNIPGKKEQAIPYLEKAVKKTTDKYKEGNIKETKAPRDAFFFLGTAYLLQYRFDDAKTYFEKYLKYLDPATDSLDYAFVKQEISAVDRARDYMAHPVAVSLENAGKNINNTKANFDPVVSGDESTLVYVTSLKFYDAVFYAKRKSRGWSTPRNITPEIQSDGDLYPAGISFDGKTLFLSRSDRFDSNIWVSYLKDGKWTKAEKMGKNINTKYWESSATLAPDGKMLYFTSNRKGGYGGLDIYVSHYNEATGEWGPATNLGPVINTEFNEETPFLSKDGQTLYFSSQGHTSMGGFDIFYASRKNGGWSEPKNVGYPVNSTDDDLFFVPIVARVYGYYSMFDPEKSIGNTDIFRVEFFSDINPRPVEFTGTLQLKNMPATYNEPVHLILKDKKTGKVVRETTVAPAGTYSLKESLPKGEYTLALRAGNYQPQTFDVTIPDDYSVSKISENVTLNPVPTAAIEYLPVIFFNFDKAKVSGEELAKINRLADLLKKYPGLVVKITGYADSKGPAGYNRRLSLKRARAVAGLLKNAGIPERRFEIYGAGETNFIAINKYPNGKDCPEGRALNRRVEITVVKSPVSNIKPARVNVPDHLKAK